MLCLCLRCLRPFLFSLFFFDIFLFWVDMLFFFFFHLFFFPYFFFFPTFFSSLLFFYKLSDQRSAPAGTNQTQKFIFIYIFFYPAHRGLFLSPFILFLSIFLTFYVSTREKKKSSVSKNGQSLVPAGPSDRLGLAPKR